jgi:hypothetical protein
MKKIVFKSADDKHGRRSSPDRVQVEPKLTLCRRITGEWPSVSCYSGPLKERDERD